MRARLLAALFALPLAGCETAAYYAQAVGGQWALMSGATPVEALIADAATPEKLRGRLALAGRIRDFASAELALADNASYRSYVALERPYVVWNVVAAPEFGVDAVQSCFPVAGCVSYRGFFSREAAERHAAGRRGEGLDVVTYGVPAYSTLGWFDDPLLSTFIHYPEVELARLIFHELAHQVVYVRDDSTFNESFAVAVEEVGVRRWLESQGRADDLALYRAARERHAAFAALVAATRVRLAALYASGRSPEDMRAAKRAEFDAMREAYRRLRAEWGGFAGYDQFFTAPNNALLASVATYTGRLPEFRRLLEASNGDLRVFYARVKALAESR